MPDANDLKRQHQQHSTDHLISTTLFAVVVCTNRDSSSSLFTVLLVLFFLFLLTNRFLNIVMVTENEQQFACACAYLCLLAYLYY